LSPVAWRLRLPLGSSKALGQASVALDGRRAPTSPGPTVGEGWREALKQAVTCSFASPGGAAFDQVKDATGRVGANGRVGAGQAL
jgi:hypothetical protein